MKERRAGIPRPVETYRWWRRQNSNLGYNPSSGNGSLGEYTRGVRDWYGVEPDKYSTHPVFMKKVSYRGEVHYTKAKEQVRREGLPTA